MLAREIAYIPLTLMRQYGSSDALRRFQLRELNRMLAYAAAHVARYRADARYAIGPLRSFAEFERLPLLDKQVLRTTPLGQLLADEVNENDCVAFQTSGTTGQRVRILHDRRSFDYHSAALVRRFLATRRYRPTDRLSHIRPFTPPARAFERFKLFRRHVLLSNRPMSEIKRELLANRPRVLVGYPVHLRTLLRELSVDELARLRGTLRIVMSESELLLPEQRALLAKAFGAPVFDEYSAFEVLGIAYDCAYGRAHLAEDRVFVEITDEQGTPLRTGEEGQVVVTAFGERAMPLIRYRLGDIGRIDPDRCQCGRRFRTLRLTRGRSNDVVVLPDGRRIFADTFLSLAAFHPGISECFVNQDSTGTVHLYVVPAPDASPDLHATVRRWVFEATGGEFALDVAHADRVELTAGGKGKFMTSDYVSPAP